MCMGEWKEGGIVYQDPYCCAVIVLDVDFLNGLGLSVAHLKETRSVEEGIGGWMSG